MTGAGESFERRQAAFAGATARVVSSAIREELETLSGLSTEQRDEIASAISPPVAQLCAAMHCNNLRVLDLFLGFVIGTREGLSSSYAWPERLSMIANCQALESDIRALTAEYELEVYGETSGSSTATGNKEE